MTFLGLDCQETADPDIAVWSIKAAVPDNQLTFRLPANRAIRASEAISELLAAAHKAGWDKHAEELAKLLPRRLQGAAV